MTKPDICRACFKPFKENDKIYLNEANTWIYKSHKNCYDPDFTYTFNRFSDIQRKIHHLIDDSEDERFFHGCRRKYSIMAHGDGPSQYDWANYIIKPCQITAPMEDLCNQIAELFDIDVPAHYLVYNESFKSPCFISKNFMEDKHYSDFKHIFLFFNKNDLYNVQNLKKIISQKTDRQKDIVRFIHTVLLDALIGNNDRHGRNLGLIVSADGYRLSPTYDTVSYLAEEPLLEADIFITGAIPTLEENTPLLGDYIKDFKRLGHESNVKDFFERISIKKIEELIEDSFIKPELKIAFLRYIKKMIGIFENELTKKLF